MLCVHPPKNITSTNTNMSRILLAYVVLSWCITTNYNTAAALVLYTGLEIITVVQKLLFSYQYNEKHEKN